MDRLSSFLLVAENDPRIGLSHICVYCALLGLCSNENDGTVYFYASELMKKSKICGKATYHKCIRDLDDYGYIKYLPSFNFRRKSKAVLINNFLSQKITCAVWMKSWR